MKKKYLIIIIVVLSILLVFVSWLAYDCLLHEFAYGFGRGFANPR